MKVVVEKNNYTDTQIEVVDKILSIYSEVIDLLSDASNTAYELEDLISGADENYAELSAILDTVYKTSGVLDRSSNGIRYHLSNIK